MRNLVLMALLLISTSCATKWTARNSNPVNAQGNTLKTDWGHIKVDYDKTTDEGVFFNIELQNNSKSPIEYQRGYVSLQSSKGDKYADLQNKLLGQNVTGAAKFASSGNKLGTLLTLGKSAYQGAKILGNGTIAPGTTHTDRLIYSGKATKGEVMTLVFGPELMKKSQANTIEFTSK